MTRFQLINNIIMVVTMLALLLASAVVSKYYFQSDAGYFIIKDFSPIFIAMGAAYLAYCFQRRQAFLVSLRDLWKDFVEMKSELIEYTYLPEPDQATYSNAYRVLSKTIDSMRGVYRNVGETPYSIGLYPFEPLHDMRKTLKELGYENITSSKQLEARRNFLKAWNALRWAFLKEFSMPEPTHPIVKYNTVDPRRTHGCDRIDKTIFADCKVILKIRQKFRKLKKGMRCNLNLYNIFSRINQIFIRLDRNLKISLTKVKPSDYSQRIVNRMEIHRRTREKMEPEEVYRDVLGVIDGKAGGLLTHISVMIALLTFQITNLQTAYTGFAKITIDASFFILLLLFIFAAYLSLRCLRFWTFEDEIWWCKDSATTAGAARSNSDIAPGGGRVRSIEEMRKFNMALEIAFRENLHRSSMNLTSVLTITTIA